MHYVSEHLDYAVTVVRFFVIKLQDRLNEATQNSFRTGQMIPGGRRVNDIVEVAQTDVASKSTKQYIQFSFE